MKKLVLSHQPRQQARRELVASTVGTDESSEDEATCPPGAYAGVKPREGITGHKDFRNVA